MILKNIFSEFIEVVKENSNYILGLINLQGYVVACSQPKLVGKKNKIANNKYNFTKKIIVNNKHLGYLWVYSEDENLEMVANLLNESLHNRIMYEFNEEKLKKNVSKEEELINYFIDKAPFNMNAVLRLFDELNINQTTQRVAIMLYRKQSFSEDEFINIKFNQNQEDAICAMLSENLILIFKTVANREHTRLNLYRDEIRTFVKKIQNLGFEECTFLVGTIQKNLTSYNKSYRQCLWLMNNIELVANELLFFEDYLFEYLMSKIPLEDLSILRLEQFNDKKLKIDSNKVIDIADKLYINNFNITKASEELFMHKNTLTYEIRKYFRNRY
ncbi:MAG: hypothetical protein L0J42_04740 [Tetragenococcus koreensis]|nr:hypothetical protein [Tetragenococcus koreensis]